MLNNCKHNCDVAINYLQTSEVLLVKIILFDSKCHRYAWYIIYYNII